MSRNDKQVNFRMPMELHDALKDSAIANMRSMTAEIVFRLEGTFARFLVRYMDKERDQ